MNRPETLLRPRVPSPLQEVRDERFARHGIGRQAACPIRADRPPGAPQARP
ncbi:hypothetical protein ACFXA0_26820 [Streptomyces cyaneofuscatus]|uniref:hypothetical protein n=1 Tax=Streptomyces cyaneofuscatus TaxID=66883 RepID=UPI0036B8AE7D